MPPPPGSHGLLIVAGVGTLALGVTHFYYPALFGYRRIFDAYPDATGRLDPFRLGPIRYPMDATKAYGIIWMMNAHVSLVLVSIGALDVAGPGWLLGPGRPMALWIAAWWALRAGSQPVLLGRLWYDWAIAAGFAALALGHAWVGLSGT